MSPNKVRHERQKIQGDLFTGNNCNTSSFGLDRNKFCARNQRRSSCSSSRTSFGNLISNSDRARNPQANAMVERVCQTIGNIIPTFNTQDFDIEDDSPWEGILSPTMFTIRFMVHTPTQHTLSQLVFGRKAILNINQEANWQLIMQCK